MYTLNRYTALAAVTAGDNGETFAVCDSDTNKNKEWPTLQSVTPGAQVDKKSPWGKKDILTTVKKNQQRTNKLYYEQEAELQRREEEQYERALKKSIEDEKKREKPFEECDPTEFPDL